jgi:cytochrome c6
MRLLDHVAAAAIGLAVLTGPPAPAFARVLTKAPDTENGARTFAYVCSACHLGGYNQVRAERTLQEAVLRENGMLAADAIEYQVINGKNRMPAFEGRLTEDEITDVAYYVVEQAQSGWNKNPKYVQYPSKYVSSKLSDAYANAANRR